MALTKTTKAADISKPQNEAFKNKGMLIAGLMIAMLFAALDNTIVGTAMPKIVGEMGGLSLITWVTTAYMLTSTTVVPIAGKLADLFGRKLIYVLGIVIFIAGSALCGVAQSMEQLIIFRGIQGIGGGVMMPMAMIIIGDLFTGKERAKWQGMFGAIFGLSSVIGPQIGGWIVDSVNWHWIFFINLPVGLVALAFIIAGLPRHTSKGPVKIDYAGIVTMITGVVSLLLALSLGGKNYPWDFLANYWDVRSRRRIFSIVRSDRIQNQRTYSADASVQEWHLYQSQRNRLLYEPWHVRSSCIRAFVHAGYCGHKRFRFRHRHDANDAFSYRSKHYRRSVCL